MSGQKPVLRRDDFVTLITHSVNLTWSTLCYVLIKSLQNINNNNY